MDNLRKAIEKDLERLRWGLLYALFNGGNLPPEFSRNTDPQDKKD